MDLNQLLKIKPVAPVGDPKAFLEISRTMDRVAIRVLIILFCTTLCLVHILPDNFLDTNPVFGAFVSFLGNYIPSIKKFSTISDYPQIFSTTYSLGILTWPLLTFFIFMKPQTRYVRMMIKYNAYSKKKISFSIIGCILLVSAALYMVPSESVGTLRYTRLLWEMNTSKLAFSTGTTLCILGISMFSAGAISWAKELTVEHSLKKSLNRH